MVAQLNSANTKSKPFVWISDLVKSFEDDKRLLSNATLLHFPVSQAPLAITTDASGIAVGSVLEQYVQGHWQPLAFFSRKLKPAETRYATFDRELLSISLSIKHFKFFVEGRSFVIYTDINP